ncbi:hypothetical protein KSP39_PZI004561 [Platanthera zijinensis]|uniref:Transposase (putative) gypsy type domain-containing protein n=1 Tax=Platanthera zijinensis TaxID=2320716 RepID=A0AAP0BVP6_9ASPA
MPASEEIRARLAAAREESREEALAAAPWLAPISSGPQFKPAKGKIVRRSTPSDDLGSGGSEETPPEDALEGGSGNLADLSVEMVDLGMTGGSGEADGRGRCAWIFADHSFPPASVSEKEFLDTVGNFIPPGFVARRPGKDERINELSGDELALPTAHFEAGLRLPLWPEVRQVFKYYGVVPGQLTPNSITVVVGFACYLREEKIEFSLAVFRKLFSFRANKDGTACFASMHAKVRETVNKSHNWLKKFVFVKGDFGNIPFSPVQLGEASYRPPSLGGHEAKLYEFFAGKNFEVAFLCRNLDDLVPVPPGEGERNVPLRPPYESARTAVGELGRAEAAALAHRELSALAGQKRSGGELTQGPPPSKKPSKTGGQAPSVGDKGKAPADQPSSAPPPRFPRPLIPLAGRLGRRGSYRRFGTPRRRFPEGIPTSATARGPRTDPWDKESNRVSVSSLLPSWSEQDTASRDAFNLSFGMYGREDASTYGEEATRVLIYESARAQFQSLALAHMVGRRCLRLDRDAPSLNKLIDEKEEARKLAQEEADDLRRRLEAADAALAQYQGGADAATASRLGTEIATLQLENQTLRARVGALEAAAAVPPASSSGCQLVHHSEYDLAVLMQENGADAVTYLFKTLQRAKLLKDECSGLRVTEVVPELFLPTKALQEFSDESPTFENFKNSFKFTAL